MNRASRSAPPRPRPPRSVALGLYLALSRVAEPALRALLARRARRGKEDAARLGERLGRASVPRPNGPLVWLHGASVGESLAALPLIEALRATRPGLGVLMTTGTVTSAAMMADRLPDGAIHQFVPVDAGPAVDRFLAHWRPDAGVWVESELWPALLHGAWASGAGLALVNARVSERSARGWRWAPGMIRGLLMRFDAVLAQDAAIARRLAGLGAPEDRLRVAGSLKAGAAPSDRPEVRAALAAALAGRPCWLAASTHPGEEAAAAEAHRLAAARIPGLIALIAPRHPERGPEIAEALRATGLRVSRRGAGEAPGPGDDVHLLDTLGEMGAWFRLAPVSFVGGSFAPVGGHNPHEPAALGSAILHGPLVANFAEDYAALRASGGAVEVTGPAARAEALGRLVPAAPARADLCEAARAALGDGRGAVEMTRDAVLALLEGRG
ncbi:MAG: 3-deoxy-D-manno-octulosonic acid transferase [Pseudomonadota bacterium]|nr:3-deoxy-D-manno-octulosonic acid transferase [Pseudomonadota bacterium]